MTKFLLICLGGAVGTGARYLVSGWVLSLFGTSFPRLIPILDEMIAEGLVTMEKVHVLKYKPGNRPQNPA